jgi:SAM-dependent methyltransferase
MHLDVQDLRNFYYRQPLGRAAETALNEEIKRIWPDTSGQTVAGFGFAVPLLRPFLTKSRRVVALMPGPQGVISWPSRHENVSVLTEDAMWPLETGHVDRLIVLHGLETSDDPNSVLEEALRVLGPGGRALFIVPNRVGLWSRSEQTPMGFGRPYTISQLETQLRIQGFLPEQSSATLFQLPSFKKGWQRFGPFLEKVGRNLPFLAGGVLIVEASKRVQPLTGSKVEIKRGKGLSVLDGFGKAKPKSALVSLRSNNKIKCDEIT